jgi:hypothetical protein
VSALRAGRFRVEQGKLSARLLLIVRLYIGKNISDAVSQVPTAVPSAIPSTVFTTAPSVVPTVSPSAAPTVLPTALPTASPTVPPSASPTVIPTKADEHTACLDCASVCAILAPTGSTFPCYQGTPSDANLCFYSVSTV